MQKNVFVITKNFHFIRLIEMIFLDDTFISISNPWNYQNIKKIDLLIIEDYLDGQYTVAFKPQQIDWNIPTIFITQKNLRQLKKMSPQKNILKVFKAPLKKYFELRNFVRVTLLSNLVCH